MREVLRFFPYVVKTAWRARSRTLLTIGGAALAMALFTFVRTVDRGVDELTRRAAEPVLVVFQESRFCPLSSELPVRYAPSIRDVPGVADVLPTLVFINSCRSNLDLVTLHGVDAQRLESLHDLEVLDGSVSAWRGRSDGALVGQRLAERRGLAVGERARLGEIDVQVSGIVRSATAGVDNLAFVHLEQLSLARKRLGKATQFLVKLEAGAGPDAVARAIDERFATDEAPTDTKSMQAFVQDAIGEITEVVEFARLIGYLAVLIVALVLANTVFISAQARTQEMGVLETLGLTKTRLAALVALEGVGLGAVGGILGAAAVLGFFAIHPTTLGIEGYGIDFEPSVIVAAQAVGASFLVGALASFGPAIATAQRPLHVSLKGD